jgi:pilus assembly protein FimV
MRFAPVKRLAPVMAMLALLIPAAGHALGLGNIAMKSALNQPLDAQIELLSVNKGDLANLTVKLGSEEDFQRVGADRAFFLTKIKFEVKRHKDGKAYVQMSTTQTVTEPFLDLVVEARWPRGRILREFTVLVDPPVLSNEAPAPMQQAAVAPQQAAPTQQATRQAPAPAARPAPIQSRATMAPVPHQAGELTYGPVKYNDTLYEIANAMRPSGVTVDQMMLALVRSNPNAFYNGNVNQLKAGYVLRVDDPSELSAYSVADAKAEVNRQHSEWRARKSGKLVRQAEAPTGGTVARGDSADGAGQSASQARLKLVAPGSKGAGSGAGDEDVEQMRQDLLLAAEALDANRQETDELKSRLAEMEEQLASMQRLIMLKDDEMQALQKQSGAEPAPAEAEAPATEAATDQSAAEALADSVEGETPEGAAPAEMGAETPEGEQAPAQAEPAPAPVTPAPMEEPGLLDNPMVMYGGLGALLLIIIAVVIQRRRRMHDSFEESILNVGGDGGDTGATAESMGGGESSMVSDFAMSEMSGMSGIETDAADVDPISEADVYLAYGRHQQAEDILNEALEKEPERNEIKLKLLEVFFAAKNRESFELKAQEFHDALGDESDPMWAKVVTMGGQLCPGSDLFGGGSAEALKEDLQVDASEGDDDLLDFDFDIDSDSVATEGATGDADTDEMFAELEAATTGSAAEAAVAESEDNSLDFDMGTDTSAEAEEPAVAEKPAADNGLDFDVSSLDFNLDTDAPAAATAEADSGDDGGLEFDLGDVDEATAGDDELGDELDDDAFGDVDEIGTKLDLAKAYVDMGDGDGAKSILDEVMEEGDDDQKKQAEELLAQIS